MNTLYAMNIIDYLPLALLGAVIGLDMVSFPQAMISRPIVASTIAGAFVGSAANGLIIGAVLELIALKTLPFGASRYPEWGTPSVVAGALYGSFPAAYDNLEGFYGIGNADSSGGALVGVTLAALLTASLSGWSMIHLRQKNVRRVRLAHYAVEHGSRRAVVSVQMQGLMGDMLRGALVTLGGLVIFRPVVVLIAAVWPLDPVVSRAVVAGMAGIVAIGAVRKIFH